MYIMYVYIQFYGLITEFVNIPGRLRNTQQFLVSHLIRAHHLNLMAHNCCKFGIKKSVFNQKNLNNQKVD